MKLYLLTEKQLRNAIISWSDCPMQDVIDKIKTIELPSDEDIFSVFRGKKMYDNDWEFINGAIWMREQIINKSKKL